MVTAGRDLLRPERFGAFYYQRESLRFAAVPPDLARLLLAGTQGNALDAYAQAPHLYAWDDATLVEQVAWARQQGWLTPEFRCGAAVVTSGETPSAPLVTHLQLTRSCNLRCSHCFVDITPRPDPDELSTAQVSSLFSELESMGSPVVVVSGGEPMLRRDFWEILEEARRHGIDVSLCTNGTLVDAEAARRLARSGVREFSVSLDGPDEESHAAMRGPGRFARAVDALRLLVDAGCPGVQARVTVTSGNIDRLPGFARVARETGVHKVAFKPFRLVPTGTARHAHDLQPGRARYAAAVAALVKDWPSDAPPADIGDGVPKRLPDWTGVIPAFGCVGGTTSASVMYDGRVLACGFVAAAGDWSLHAHTFRECWTRAPTVRAWRELAGNDECRACGNSGPCGGGCRARALGSGSDLDAPDPWADCSVGVHRSGHPRLPQVQG